MAQDFFHHIVRHALQKDGWEITHDPYELRLDSLEMLDARMKIDLGAERLIAATKDSEKIAVEVKSLLGPSLIYDLHNLVGQYVDYQIGLEEQEPDRLLFVAIPSIAYERLESQPFFEKVCQRVNLKIIVFNPNQQNIIKWKK